MTATIFRALCGKCRCRLRIPSNYLHQVVRCTNCRRRFRVKPRRIGHSFSDTGWQALRPIPGDANAFVGLTVRAVPAAQPSKVSQWLLFAGFGLAVLSLSAIGFFFRARIVQPAPVAMIPAAPVAEATPPKQQQPPKAAPAPTAKAAMVLPRRLLAICVSEYLYANPVSFGSIKKNPTAIVERLSDKFGVAKPQQYLITDVRSNRGAVPPLKPIIETSIARFAETSRPQDRIILLFAGHAAMIDGKPYLVPLEGDLKDASTLIALDWVYDQLKRCKARQKILVIDVNRYDPSHGTERPSAGAMDPGLEAALKHPPEGIQVWSACSAQQFSHEFRYQAFDKYEVEGGLFLNQIFNAFQKHGSAPAKPDDAIPIDLLASHVAPLTEAMATAVAKEAQTPFLAGAEKPGGAAYDPSEPPAQAVAIPKPRDVAQGVADELLVKQILDEIKLPPIKAVAVGDATDDISFALPFSASRLQAYDRDYDSVEDLLKDPDKFPLRVTVLRAVEVLQRHGRGEVRVGQSTKHVGKLRQTFQGPLTDGLKRQIETEQRAIPAVMSNELEEVLSSLADQEANRASESSQRWQAHFDYVQAIAKCRYAYLNEYNLMLGKIRKDELPALDPTLHNGWRLAAQEKMASPRDIKDKAEEAKELFSKIIKEHAGTPWEVLARRERLTTLGLAWQPTSIKEPAAAEPAKPKRGKGK